MIDPMPNERIKFYAKWFFFPGSPVAGILCQNQQKTDGLHPSSSLKHLDQYHNDGDHQQGMDDAAHRVASQ
jgi:hypothetical protein